LHIVRHMLVPHANTARKNVINALPSVPDAKGIYSDDRIRVDCYNKLLTFLGETGRVITRIPVPQGGPCPV
jgi:hypothetical protein